MSEQNKVKEYSNDGVTVVWKSDLCIHSEKCFKGLPEVFNPQARPWIDASGASNEAIVAQVKQCPSGALSYRSAQAAPQAAGQSEPAPTRVEVIPNGPLAIGGPVTVASADGEKVVERPKVFLCRCGHSQNKPYCDGAHKKVGFEAP